jgi:nitroreductase
LDVFEAVQARKSVRAYESQSVPEEVLLKVLEAGRLAPSAVNYQPWHFVVVRDEEKRRAIGSSLLARFLRECPVVIVGCADRQKSPKWSTVDVAIAMQQMVLTAVNEGLGTCWVGAFDEENVKGILKIPDRYSVIALLAVGYPREKPGLLGRLFPTRKRKALEEITSVDEFGRPMPK